MKKASLFGCGQKKLVGRLFSKIRKSTRLLLFLASEDYFNTITSTGTVHITGLGGGGCWNDKVQIYLVLGSWNFFKSLHV